MLKDNLVMLRNLHGWSQEEIAEKIGISRQAYAKWERGTTVPDIEKCRLLAEVYGTTLDNLVSTGTVEGIGTFPPPPKGKSIWGSVIVNERGQIVIPKGARDRYGFTEGRRLVVLGDETGIALVRAEILEAGIKEALELMRTRAD